MKLPHDGKKDFKCSWIGSFNIVEMAIIVKAIYKSVKSASKFPKFLHRKWKPMSTPSTYKVMLNNLNEHWLGFGWKFEQLLKLP